MNRIASLAGLRAVAAYSVLFAHIIDADLRGNPVAHDFASRLAHLAMSLFFVLSGFIIHYKYATAVRTGRGILTFFIARFARLYPMYLVVVCIYAAANPDGASRWSVLSYATMTQSWFNTQEAFLTATWSISTEWFFYICFVALVLGGVLERIKNPAKCACLYVAMVTATLLLIFSLETPIVALIRNAPLGLFEHGTSSAPPWYWFIYQAPWLRAFEFGLGVLVSLIYRAGSRRIGHWPAALAVLWSVMLIVPVDLGSSIADDFLFNFAYTPALALIVLYSFQERNPISTLLRLRPMVWAGEISYSIYLLQFLCHNSVRLFITDIVSDIAVTFVVTTLAAIVTYRLIEAPLRLLIRRKAEQLLGEAPSFAAAAVRSET